MNEPFVAYYDKHLDRSRTDYYDGDYKIYQFGPKSENSTTARVSPYGSIYKYLYVPASFHPKMEIATKAASGVSSDSSQTSSLSASQPKRSNRAKLILSEAYKRVSDVFSHHYQGLSSYTSGASDVAQQRQQQQQDQVRTNTRTPVKRICFGVEGGVGFTISAQTVLPDLKDYQYDSTGKCPQTAFKGHRHAKCELWKLITTVGEKKNTYKFWLRRDPNDSNQIIPVYYYMLGYDRLLGSHYDRYDISYYNYKINGANDEDFALNTEANKCGPMPGPGDEADEGERRAHLVISNPIHEFVSEPHRYDHIDHHFEQFQQDHERNYKNQNEERQSWFNFMNNLRFILGKNRELKEYKLSLNKFADSNVDELRYLRGRLHSKGYNGGLDYGAKHPLKTGAKELDALPESFDWNARGAVSQVKDQAVCGSCWSFGTAGAVEGAYFVKTGKLLRLSQQQLIDCSWQFGNNGCDGGEDFRAYKYIQQAGGLSTEEDYGHYLASDGKCHDMDVEKPVKIRGFYNVTTNSIDALKHAIVNYGPVSISIDASPTTFAFYSHGAYYDANCKNDPNSLDHAVLAVGYLNLNGKLVWKVKNSWSTYWGNDGYIYIQADNNVCGVLDAPTVPIIDA